MDDVPTAPEPIILESRPDPQQPDVVYLGLTFRRSPKAGPSCLDSRVFRLQWPMHGWVPMRGSAPEVIEALDAESGDVLVLARAAFVPANSPAAEPVPRQQLDPRLPVKRARR